MFRAARIQVPKYDLNNLHWKREEDGECETMDPQFLLGSELLKGLDSTILETDLEIGNQKACVRNKSSQDLILPRIDQGVGSTSGIRACALRNFDLGIMELENSQNNALAKLPMLKLGEYEMWEIRIKQYFQIQDYALWEVIENGNSWVPIPVTAPESGPSTALKMTVPSTTDTQDLFCGCYHKTLEVLLTYGSFESFDPFCKQCCQELSFSFLNR
ncbi:hypothetical protein Tco_0199222 [Tanacetum coccineum]